MENLAWGLQMTVLGMGLVFALLALLWGLLMLVLVLDKEPKAPMSEQETNAEAERIAAEVCRPGKFNGNARRVIVSVDPVR